VWKGRVGDEGVRRGRGRRGDEEEEGKGREGGSTPLVFSNTSSLTFLEISLDLPHV
jgi:hypothetical protein